MEQTICPYCGAAQQPMMNWWTGVLPDMQGQPMMYQQQGYEQQQAYDEQYTQQGYEQQQAYDGQYMQQGYGQQMMAWPAGAASDMQGQHGAKKPVNGKIIGIIAGVVVVLALVMVFVIKFIGSGAPTQKAAIKSYVEAIIDENTDEYLDACYPKKLQKGFMKECDISDADFKYIVKQMLSGYAESDNIRNIKIVNKHKLDEHEVDYFENEIMNEFDVKIKVSELVRVEYEYEAKEDGEWKKDSDIIRLYKTKGKWFVEEDLIIQGIKYNGTYELSEISTMGVAFSAEEFEEISGLKLDMTLTIKGNKCTLSADMAGMGVAGAGDARIKFSGDTVTIEDGRQTITGTYDSKEKTITLTSQGVDMVFKKR